MLGNGGSFAQENNLHVCLNFQKAKRRKYSSDNGHKVKLNHFALKRFVISVIWSTLVDFNMILVAKIKGIKSSKRQKKTLKDEIDAK